MESIQTPPAPSDGGIRRRAGVLPRRKRRTSWPRQY